MSYDWFYVEDLPTYDPRYFGAPVPSSGVFDQPTVQICLNKKWASHIGGILDRLVHDDAWIGTAEEKRFAIEETWRLIAAIQAAPGGCDPELPEHGKCISYALDSEFIEWAPNDPFRTPNLVPPGYVFPPWYVVGGSIPFTGLQAGDVITDLLHSPSDTLQSGYPRFRIHLKGEGTVELHFVRFFTASLALITVDDQVSSARFTDLNTALLASVGNLEAEQIIEVRVTGAGDHHVDVTITSAVSEDPPWVHFGGGIRRIVLCGFDDSPIPCPECPEETPCAGCGSYEDEYQMPTRFNTETCNWEISADGTNWCPIWEGWKDCVQAMIEGSTGNPGNHGEGEIPLGECRTYKFELDGSGQWKAPVPVRHGYTIKTDILSGAGFDGNGWYCPNGQGYILGGCFGSPNAAASYDPAQSLHHMVVAGFFDNYSENYELDSAKTTAYSISSTVQAYTDFIVKWNDGQPTDNSGKVIVQVTICHNDDGEISGGLQLLNTTEEENITITTLIDGVRWHVHAPYNNSPTGGGDPVTVAQCILMRSGDNVGGKWLIDNLTGWADAANYTNNGAIYTAQWLNSGVAVPHPLTGQSWAEWFNTNYSQTNIFAIDMRSTVASTPLEFDVTIIP